MIRLLRCPWSSLSERAWNAIHDLAQDAKPGELECAKQRTIMIIPFPRLYGLVATHRAAELERLKGDVLAALELDAVQYPVGPNVFDLAVQETSAKARARWQELVLFPTHGDALDADQQQAWYDRLFDVIMDNNGS
ncbi:hypothetical protein NLG97_g8440 [Lecanicillium saksenae]|uniref:Uncharacterized protein n=1 Tax=Lecanicillium saksenae TaxID=468837 RepID=A0ACC1QIW8_9HYPO|nr:hypothetical protein NLG97_g8440 [Lecanicillium saksenae]